MEDTFLRTVDNSIIFLRMAATELRRIAERAADVTGELCRIADKLDADADELQTHRAPFGNGDPP